jgi:hypothetical protein
MNTFCLLNGTNTIEVVYSLKKGEASRPLEVSIRTATQTSGGWQNASKSQRQAGSVAGVAG